MPSTPTAQLEGISEHVQDQRFPLGLGPTLLGRGSSCSAVIRDPRVSRIHAEIRFEDGHFVIRDLGSTHGTFVDGAQVQQTRLKQGSRIRFGDSEFVFHEVQDAIPTMMEAEMELAAPVVPPSSPPPGPPSPSTGSPQEPQLPPAISTAAATAGAPESSSSTAKATRNRIFFGCGIIVSALVCLCLAGTAMVAIFYPGGLSAAAYRILSGTTVGYTDEDLALALSVPLVDERPQVLENLGRPDAFDISIVDVEGGQVRRETWYYYGYGTRVDFIDGTIVWTIELEPAPEGAIFPAWYDPTAFSSGMSIEAASNAAAAASPADTVPEVIDLSSGGEDLTGAMLLVGDQITLAFQDGALVYVETIGVTSGGGG
jgi:pSer/pThr/pTyr-binding forkhead associated (FHA) protein